MSVFSKLFGGGRSSGEMSASEYHAKLDDIQRRLDETKPQIEALRRGAYDGLTNDQIAAYINRGRR